jgi:tetratricopeptide (TPR) repeat protein
VRHLCLFFLFSLCLSLRAAPHSESQYAQALLAYREGRSKEALGLIDTLLKEAPREWKAWELRGLLLKEMGEFEPALELFKKLADTASEQNLSNQETAPYTFQIGVLLYELKRAEEAVPYFNKSAQEGFNAAAAEYFLGLIALSQGKIFQAEMHFRHAAYGKAGLLSAAAYYYLGTLAKNQDNSRSTIWNWKESHRLAKGILSASPPDHPSAAAKALVEQVERSLRERDVGLDEWYAEVALVTSYDSNVLLNPAVDSGAIGPSTPSQMARFSAGLPLSLRDNLLELSWRGFGNYNFQSGSHGGQFIWNELGIVYTLTPHAFFHGGFRTGALLVFRFDGISVPGLLKRQSLGAPLAPFFALSGENAYWMTEFALTPQIFFTDPGGTSTLAKSGLDWRFHSELHWRRKNRLFRPMAEIEIYRIHTSGEEFRMSGFSFSVANRFLFSEKFSGTLRLKTCFHTYSERLGDVRQDIQLSAAFEAKYQLWNTLSALSEINYLDNLSNISALYRYRRFVVGLGVDYRF